MSSVSNPLGNFTGTASQITSQATNLFKSMDTSGRGFLTKANFATLLAEAKARQSQPTSDFGATATQWNIGREIWNVGQSTYVGNLSTVFWAYHPRHLPLIQSRRRLRAQRPNRRPRPIRLQIRQDQQRRLQPVPARPRQTPLPTHLQRRSPIQPPALCTSKRTPIRCRCFRNTILLAKVILTKPI